MQRYTIELRGRNQQSQLDFSLNLYRLGQKIRLGLQSHALPQPFLGTDPETGLTYGCIYLESEKSQDELLNRVCTHFEHQCRGNVSCRVVSNSQPPQTTKPNPFDR